MSVVDNPLGIHDLVDERVPARMVESAGLRPGQVVLDAGAGLGALTKLLSSAVAPGGRVLAVEKDAARAAALSKLSLTATDVVVADLLEMPLPTLDAIVANPPFRILPTLVRRWLTHGFQSAVLVMPAELAERICAKPGEPRYGKLSVEVAVQAKAELLFYVARRAFEPVPAVPCAVIRLTPKPCDVPLDALSKVLEAAWSDKAKTLRHSLSKLAGQDGLVPQDVTQALSFAQASGRPFTEVSPWEFGQIAKGLASVLAKDSA